MKRMLINATQPEELRVAMIDGQKLYNFDIDISTKEQKKSSIYKGIITRIEPSLEAVFVNYGAEKYGFLPFKEIAAKFLNTESSSQSNEGHLDIKNQLKEKQEIIVQIEKEERNNKGAALTTYISLAGTYMVLMPNNPEIIGISKRIEGETRNELRQVMNTLKMPKNMGIIVRTLGCGKNTKELQDDLNYLAQLWKAIDYYSSEKPAPFLIFQESNIIIRALRDYLKSEIDEILIDSEESYLLVKKFLSQIMPDFLQKAKWYQNSVPLFSYYQIESQIESAYNRTVLLPSGGSIVIDRTEALTSIDVNSSRSTKGIDIEETALHTNLEASKEIALQLRLRDLGGLFILDFIGMTSNKNQIAVETCLRDAFKIDRARIRIGNISSFGLIEMSRQRLRPSLSDSTHLSCPRCNGQGSVRNIESVSLSILRIIEEHAIKKDKAQIISHLPIECATFLLNEKRSVLRNIEKNQKVIITLLPSKHMETPDYNIECIKSTKVRENKASYSQIKTTHTVETPEFVNKTSYSAQEPVVKEFLQNNKTSSTHNKKNTVNIIQHLWNKLTKITKNNNSHNKTYRANSSKNNRRYRHRNQKSGRNQTCGSKK